MTKRERYGLLSAMVLLAVVVAYAVANDKRLTLRTPYGSLQTQPDKCDAILSDVESANNGGDGVVVKGQGTPCVERLKSHDNKGTGVLLDKTPVQPPAVTPPAAIPDTASPGQR